MSGNHSGFCDGFFDSIFQQTAFCFLFANYKLWWASALVGLNGKNVVFFSCLLCVFLLISVI